MAERPWSVKRATVEQYEIRGPLGAWAIITLDPRGIFQAVSDFGTYSYDGWGYHGCASFKHFLVQLREADYFLSKVCGNEGGRGGPGRGGQVFDWDKSMAEIRRRICEKRREGLPKDEAREAWDELEDLEHTFDATYFVIAVERDCPTLFKRVLYSNYCEVPACTVLAPLPLRFFNEIFRGQLVPALEAELAAEAAAEITHAAGGAA